MAVLTLSSLKSTKNSVIGNPQAKLALARDAAFVKSLVECLHSPANIWQDPQGSSDDIRIEAAHIISSLSYGSEAALASLLASNAVDALIYAIGDLKPSTSNTLKAALTRALRTLAAAIAEAVGPSQWGLRAESTDIRFDAKLALDIFFQVGCLDIYLPLLAESTSAVQTSICLLIASAVRDPIHRKAISEWLPPSDRAIVHRVRRWEKPDAATSHAPSRQGGWLARHLMSLSQSRDTKLQEAALSALASIAKDNSSVANALTKQVHGDVPSSLTTIISLTKSRSADVQLAACLCATNTVRSATPSHSHQTDDPIVVNIINLINRFLDNSNPQTQTKACFVLFNLVKDDSYHCDMAKERHTLDKLAHILNNTCPPPPPPTSPDEWDEDEPESTCALREACMTVLAATCIFDPQIRTFVCDELNVIPIIQSSLTHRHVGVRYAACQCVRAFSREVSILRTTMLDSGLGMSIFRLFKSEQEDRRVTFAALTCVCNLVNDFSPLRPHLMEQGLLERLVMLVKSDDPTLRVNAMWAIKNLLNRASRELKRQVMEGLGWPYLRKILGDPDDDVREQAFTVVQNLADDEDGVDLVLKEIGEEEMMGHLASGLGSGAHAVQYHAVCLLANILNGTEYHQSKVLSSPRILSLLRACLEPSSISSSTSSSHEHDYSQSTTFSSARDQVKRPAIMSILQVSSTNPASRKVMIDAGILSALRSFAESEEGMRGSGMGFPLGIGARYSAGGGGDRGPGNGGGGGYRGAGDDTSFVIDKARLALYWLQAPPEDHL